MDQDNIYVTTDEATGVIPFKSETIRNSRSTGTLGGRKAPPFIKAGRKVLYLKSDLIEWMEGFPKFKNTSEEAIQEN